MTGSNRRPSRCKRDALPTELTARRNSVPRAEQRRNRLDHGHWTHFVKIPPECVARVGRQLNVDAPAIMRIRPPDKQPLTDERL